MKTKYLNDFRHGYNSPHHFSSIFLSRLPDDRHGIIDGITEQAADNAKGIWKFLWTNGQAKKRATHWLDKHIEAQAEQKATLNNLAAPQTAAELCENHS